MVASPSCPARGEVHVWHARTDEFWADGARVDRALSWLDASERRRHDRYRLDIDRRMFLLGRVMARALVGRALDVAPTAWPWRENRYGRPEVDDDRCGLFFNLAHSAGVVVCALAREADVGVDIEDRQRRQVDSNVVRRYCSPGEIADIERQGPLGWHDRFLKYWTLKEAYLKARGLGIAVHLSDVSFSLSPLPARVAFFNSLAGTSADWAFLLTELEERHFLAAAAPLLAGAAPTFIVEPLPREMWV